MGCFQTRTGLGRVAVLLALALGGCRTGHPRLTAPPAPEFRPDVFFDGRTQGTGTLTIRGRAPQTVRVESVGAWKAGGLFRLDQTIRLGDDAPRTRTWWMHRDAAGRYAATLTDASEPVDLTVDGSTLTIRYRMGTITTMTQHLTLRPDGRSALNLATVRALGLPWARLTEEIVRVDAP